MSWLAVQLSAVDGVDIYGPPPAVGRAALCSFNVKGLHASDVSTVLDQAGAHARPLLECFHKCLQMCLPSEQSWHRAAASTMHDSCR